MEQPEVKKNPAQGEETVQEEINKARQQLKTLRENLVKRIVQRATTDQEWTPDLRANPDQYPPLDPSKVQWEVLVARIVVTHLLDPATTLPLDVDTMHRRICNSPMGAEYTRALALMGFPTGPQALLARLCGQKVLDALQLHLGPRAGGGPRRMWILRLERAQLAGLVGVVDPMPTAPVILPDMQAMAGALRLMMGQGPPGQSLGMPGGMPMPGQGFMPPVPMPPLMGGQLMPGQDSMPSIVMLPPNGVPPPVAPEGGPTPPPQGQGAGAGGAADGGGGAGNKRGADMDLDALLSRKTQRDRMQLDSGTGAELQAVLARPTAREAARIDVFRTADGASAIQEHCSALTKEDCKRLHNSPVACNRVHFKRVIRPHTDVSLGNCSYLNTCRNFHRCKYIHYDIDDEDERRRAGPLVPGMPGALGMPHALMGPVGVTGQQGKMAPPVPKYLQALKDPQWICCDIRKLDMKVLGKFGVIMADPPWQIHQDLPYGTMEDEEMRRMDIGCLQDDGVIFLWVTGRAMELGRECLKIWGYDRVDELIWVKTNQLNRLIRTGRTGHWINHSKEHCLIGVKGKPALNKHVDCDVVIAEVRETSRKPDEMYPLLERLSPGTRKLEIFAREHNRKAGWVGLGNQLPGVEALEPEFRARYIARYGPPGPDGRLPLPH